ncbi:protein kinase [Amycolatopsis sp. NPDC051372]|uniref:protein kinase domain-containing protein n=1 Tax=Amycolatopsis sp. NPDC051372 TaxID=3155669 RepID=UPI0034443C72
MSQQPRIIAERYELTMPIGRGGMGEVWAAYDTRLDRTVALKILRPEISADGTSGRALIARFRREARLTARLEHPGVPAVFDVGAHEGQLFLVMQLVNGLDLADFIATKGPCPVEWSAAIGAQIAAVLSAAHAVSLVHRDLKPRNIMVANGGTVVVLDFGVAALLDPDITRVTMVGEAVGSPAYLAPEQLTSANISPRSDLYSLGCVLHELISGEPVFNANTPAALMYAHLQETPRPLRDCRPDVPEPLERLVLDLLAKDPENRPESAVDVYTALLPFVPRPAEGLDPAEQPDPVDPTRPYRFPLAPRPTARRTSVAVPQPAAEQNAAEIRERAAELAEAGRLTQAAGLLGGYLRDNPDDRGVRFQYANTLFLGGDYRTALPVYDRLAEDFTRSAGGPTDGAVYCRFQAANCLAELGELTEALRGLRSVVTTEETRGAGDSALARDTRKQVAGLLAATGDYRGALLELEALVERVEDQFGPSHDEAADLRNRVAMLRRASGGGS